MIYDLFFFNFEFKFMFQFQVISMPMSTVIVANYK